MREVGENPYTAISGCLKYSFKAVWVLGLYRSYLKNVDQGSGQGVL
jgi:hypothetical protein